MSEVLKDKFLLIFIALIWWCCLIETFGLINWHTLESNVPGADAPDYLQYSYDLYHETPKGHLWRPYLYALIIGIPFHFTESLIMQRLFILSIHVMSWLFVCCGIFDLLRRATHRKIAWYGALTFLTLLSCTIQTCEWMTETLYSALLFGIFRSGYDGFVAQKKGAFHWMNFYWGLASVVRPIALLPYFSFLAGMAIYFGVRRQDWKPSPIIFFYLFAFSVLAPQYGLMHKTFGEYKFSYISDRSLYVYTLPKAEGIAKTGFTGLDLVKNRTLFIQAYENNYNSQVAKIEACTTPQQTAALITASNQSEIRKHSNTPMRFFWVHLLNMRLNFKDGYHYFKNISMGMYPTFANTPRLKNLYKKVSYVTALQNIILSSALIALFLYSWRKPWRIHTIPSEKQWILFLSTFSVGMMLLSGFSTGQGDRCHQPLFSAAILLIFYGIHKVRMVAKEL